MNSILNWIGDKTGQIIGAGAKGITIFICNFDGAFIIVAIVGIYLIMAGSKKLGTKLTSGAFILYLICKVIACS